MHLSYSTEDLLRLLPDATLEGAADVRVTGLAPLAEAGPTDLSFLASQKYRADLQATKAGIVLVPRGMDASPSEGQAFLRVDDPSLALAELCEHIEAQQRPAPPAGVHPSAVVAESATIDPSASVGPYCTVGEDAVVGPRSILEAHVHIGRGARVGEDCYLHPRVTLHDYCVLGRRVRVQPGAVIGADGFGYIQVGKVPNLVHRKVPQIGIVFIEDDVEIGANACIDRARFGETRIGQGTKIDNLVQIGHNVRIGRHCIICAHVGISGSTTLGNYVVLWGQAGVIGHIEIGDGAFVGAQAGVAKSIPPGGKVTGTPARPLVETRRQEAALARLPELLRDLQRTPSASGADTDGQ